MNIWKIQEHQSERVVFQEQIKDECPPCLSLNYKNKWFSSINVLTKEKVIFKTKIVYFLIMS